MKKFLFICGKNQLRSPSAENVFSECPNLEVRSAGVDNDAIYKVQQEDVVWADYIFLMENKHKEKLVGKFRDSIKNQKVIVLDIKDMYTYMDVRLVDVLKQKVEKYLS